MRKTIIAGMAIVVIATIPLLVTSPVAHAWVCADLVKPGNALTCNNMSPEWQQKKRAKQMGVDLGSKFEATVEKARSGKLIKEMT